METKEHILITGATGTIGSELVRQLHATGVAFSAMTRTGTAAADWPCGVRVVRGDFNDKSSLDRVLQGVTRAFLLTNSSELAEEQQLRFVDAAQRAELTHIVKLSQWAADIDSPVRFLRYHAEVENRILASGIGYTFLRPNLFMQGVLAFRDAIVREGHFFGAAGDAEISVIDVRDIAAVAKCALTQDGHAGKIYNLTGPEALSHEDMAVVLGRAVGKPIQYVDIDGIALRQFLLSAGFPGWQADGLVEDYAHYARGEGSSVESGVYDATGIRARNFADFAADHASLFTVG